MGRLELRNWDSWRGGGGGGGWDVATFTSLSGLPCSTDFLSRRGALALVGDVDVSDAPACVGNMGTLVAPASVGDLDAPGAPACVGNMSTRGTLGSVGNFGRLKPSEELLRRGGPAVNICSGRGGGTRPGLISGSVKLGSLSG